MIVNNEEEPNEFLHAEQGRTSSEPGSEEDFHGIPPQNYQSSHYQETSFIKYSVVLPINSNQTKPPYCLIALISQLIVWQIYFAMRATLVGKGGRFLIKAVVPLQDRLLKGTNSPKQEHSS